MKIDVDDMKLNYYQKRIIVIHSFGLRTKIQKLQTKHEKRKKPVEKLTILKQNTYLYVTKRYSLYVRYSNSYF